jgi:N-acetyltransferase 10
MGYGSRALELLSQYYEGGMTNLSEKPTASSHSMADITPTTDANVLQTEEVAPRKNVPPLLTALGDRPPEGLHWMAVSFGLTLDLLNFWIKAKYKPVYLRLTSNDITGEHTCIMIKPQVSVTLQTMPDQNWLDSFHKDFKRRFLSLLSYQFNKFPTALALSFVFSQSAPKEELGMQELKAFFDDYDLKRLQSYAHNLVDYHMVLDLLPSVARLFFLNRVNTSLSFTQAAILLAMGLQHKDVTSLEAELGLPSNQILAQFNKAVRKISTCFSSLHEKEVREELTSTTAIAPPVLPPVEPLAREMKRNSTEVTKGLQEKQRELLAGMNLKKYAIGGSEEAWDEALKGKSSAGAVSVKSSREKSHKFEGKKRKG